MSEKIINLTKTYIPIVTVVSIIVGIMGLAWYFGGESMKTNIISQRLDKMELQLKEMPQRSEFDDLRDRIAEMRTDLKTIMNYIAKK